MHPRHDLFRARLDRRELLIGAGATLSVLGLGRRAAAQESEPAASASRPLRFYALGDTGLATEPRARAIEALAARAERDPADFVLLLGDNFYESGIQSADDARWKTDFEELFGAPSLQVPFHAVLGNHDHFGRIEAQVEYTAKSTRWRMPARYRAFTSGTQGTHDTGVRADFFLLDTDPMLLQEDHDLEQLAWLETELAKDAAPWRIAAGHHPLRSGGLHRGEPVPAELAGLFEQGEVDLYLSGHDHDLQLLTGSEPWLQVVSGATAKPRPTALGEGSRFASSDPGFVVVELDAEALRIEFVTAPGETRHVEQVPRRARAAAGSR
jgi:tartrate-resistant acid phosphatase type 5